MSPRAGWTRFAGSSGVAGFSLAASSRLIDRTDDEWDDSDRPTLGCPAYLKLEPWLSRLALVALFCAGLCDGTSMVIRHAILRLASPEALRGRIAAVKSVFTGSSNELGTFQSGMTASLIGAGPTLVVGGGVTLGVVAFVAWRARQLLNLNLETLARPVQLDADELEAAANDPLLEIATKQPG